MKTASAALVWFLLATTSAGAGCMKPICVVTPGQDVDGARIAEVDNRGPAIEASLTAEVGERSYQRDVLIPAGKSRHKLVELRAGMDAELRYPKGAPPTGLIVQETEKPDCIWVPAE